MNHSQCLKYKVKMESKLTEYLTGNWYWKKRFFGGFTLMVEVHGEAEHFDDGHVTDRGTYWKKGKEQHLHQLKIPMSSCLD